MEFDPGACRNHSSKYQFGGRWDGYDRQQRCVWAAARRIWGIDTFSDRHSSVEYPALVEDDIDDQRRYSYL